MSEMAYYEGNAPDAPVTPARASLTPLGIIALLLATLLGAFSWQAGGLTELSNAAFILLTFCSAIFLLREMLYFNVEFGLGKIVFYAGVLIWFCQDYFANWFFYSPDRMVEAWVIGKSTFYHCLFVLCVTLGLQLQGIPRFTRWMLSIREPRSPRAYFPTIILTTILGLLPLLLFSNENFFVSVYKSIVAGRGGGGPELLLGRTGNFNYNWGAYIFRLYDVGNAGAIFAAYYVLFMSRSRAQNIVCGLIWTFWLLMGFGTGARGQVVMLIVPAASFIYLRYQLQAATLLRRISWRAYVYAAMALGCGFVLAQIQIAFRNQGYTEVHLQEVEFAKPQGNHMFTEGLTGFKLVPDVQPYFYNTVPGEMVIAPLPVEAFFFAIHPIPRALWNSKPADPAWEWYNQVVANTGQEGTTISHGLVGHWYFRYGIFGIIEGGLLFGLLLRSIEEAFRQSALRPMTVFLTAGLLMVFFRMFRNFMPMDFYALLVGLAVMWVALRIMGAGAAAEAPAEAAAPFP